MADGEDEAARAFEDLRAEVSLMRSAVDRLAAERAEPSDTPDYAETLGIMSRNLSATAQRIDAVVNSPALALTPHEIGRQIIEIGTAGRNEDRRAIAAARQVIEEVATRLGRQLDSHVMAEDQRRQHRRASLTALLVGALLWAILAGPIVRSLPSSWLSPERMAARTLRMPMWEGGQRLMRAASPRAFASIVAGNRLVTADRDMLQACRKRAGRAGKPVHCAIEVKPEG
ncbi:DUF6118 family protein [Sphingomonas sp. M1A8_2b]